MDGKKTLGIFKSKERRCGEKAIYFKSRTVESIESIKIKYQAILAELIKKVEEEKEFNGRIENMLDRRIRKALIYDGGYTICSCNSITFNYRNDEGMRIIVDTLLKQFDIKEKKAINENVETK